MVSVAVRVPHGPCMDRWKGGEDHPGIPELLMRLEPKLRVAVISSMTSWLQEETVEDEEEVQGWMETVRDLVRGGDFCPHSTWVAEGVQVSVTAFDADHMEDWMIQEMILHEVIADSGITQEPLLGVNTQEGVELVKSGTPLEWVLAHEASQS